MIIDDIAALRNDVSVVILPVMTKLDEIVSVVKTSISRCYTKQRKLLIFVQNTKE